MTRRYVIAEHVTHESPGLRFVLDLPDAEHIHLTRRADGGWDAVPMRKVRPARMYAADVASSDALRRCAWVDAPEQGSDR